MAVEKTKILRVELHIIILFIDPLTRHSSLLWYTVTYAHKLTCFMLLCLPSIEVETYCFTSHCSVVRPISFVSVRSLRLSFRRSNTRRWPNAGLLLANPLQCWADISSVLGYPVLFDATLNVGQRHRRRANINPAFVFDLNGPKSLKFEEQTKDSNQTYWHLRVRVPNKL